MFRPLNDPSREFSTLRDKVLDGLSFKDQDLQYVDFRGSWLWRTDLSGAYLYGADFRDSTVCYAILRGARGVVTLESEGQTLVAFKTHAGPFVSFRGKTYSLLGGLKDAVGWPTSEVLEKYLIRELDSGSCHTFRGDLGGYVKY